MITLFVLASGGAGALLFMLAFLRALVHESRPRRSSRTDRRGIDRREIDQDRTDQEREASLTLVMLERYRNDRAA